MSLSFYAKDIQAESDNTRNRIRVTVEVEDDADILEEVDIKDAISHYHEDELLDAIGVDKAKDYFDIVEE